MKASLQNSETPTRSIQYKYKELRPIKDNDRDYESLEEIIRKFFKDEIYSPLAKILGVSSRSLTNAKSTSLVEAISSGRVSFYRGQFSGRFSAAISKELKALGAVWDRSTRTWRAPQSSLPHEIRAAISVSETRFQQKLDAVDTYLANILPEQIAAKFKIAEHFDTLLWKTDKNLKSILEGITVSPSLSPEQRMRIAFEWEQNLSLDIKGWTQKEVETLREKVRQSVLKGERISERVPIVSAQDALLRTVKGSHDRAIKKAKFLARQETRLLMSTFQQVRYEDAGVTEYKWGISNNPIQPSNSAPYIKGQVRHDHGALAGKIFRWDNPPVTDTRTGARNNPGQDYNCRCHAIPIIRVRK